MLHLFIKKHYVCKRCNSDNMFEDRIGINLIHGAKGSVLLMERCLMKFWHDVTIMN